LQNDKIPLFYCKLLEKAIITEILLVIILELQLFFISLLLFSEYRQEGGFYTENQKRTCKNKKLEGGVDYAQVRVFDCGLIVRPVNRLIESNSRDGAP
jgi:hypothetical protein